MSDAQTAAEHWNGRGGEAWVRRQETLDAVLRPLGRMAIDAAALRDGSRVVDLGCGCGDTTVDIAERVGAGGRVLAVDVSAPMLGRAGERIAEKGLRDRVELVVGDAAAHAFAPGAFDAIVSRFGIMFFERPAEALGNLRRALRKGGVLAFVCWRPLGENAWASVPLAAVASVAALPSEGPPDGPGPFAFADPERLRAILDAAGFVDVTLSPEDIELPLGPHGPGTRFEDVVAYALEIGPAARAIAGLDEPARAQARAAVEEALRAVPAREAADESRWLPGAVWLVTARSPG